LEVGGWRLDVGGRRLEVGGGRVPQYAVSRILFPAIAR
jgi:hypothetical protein